jgi:hypothetical protein
LRRVDRVPEHLCRAYPHLTDGGLAILEATKEGVTAAEGSIRDTIELSLRKRGIEPAEAELAPPDSAPSPRRACAVPERPLSSPTVVQPCQSEEHRRTLSGAVLYFLIDSPPGERGQTWWLYGHDDRLIARAGQVFASATDARMAA